MYTHRTVTKTYISTYFLSQFLVVLHCSRSYITSYSAYSKWFIRYFIGPFVFKELCTGCFRKCNITGQKDVLRGTINLKYRIKVFSNKIYTINKFFLNLFMILMIIFQKKYLTYSKRIIISIRILQLLQLLQLSQCIEIIFLENCWDILNFAKMSSCIFEKNWINMDRSF